MIVEKLMRRYRLVTKRQPLDLHHYQLPYKLHFGPGPEWVKPSTHWLAIGVEHTSDIRLDFNKDQSLPLPSGSVSSIYGSHVFEHMSIFAAPRIFSERYRVLKMGGSFRLVLPDAERSIREYVSGNRDFQLFRRRMERAKTKYNKDYSLFEALKEDFLSPSGQRALGDNTLAHQNAWDFESLCNDLARAGFRREGITRKQFQETSCRDFDFEGTYPAEANEDYRSMYVEVTK